MRKKSSFLYKLINKVNERIVALSLKKKVYKNILDTDYVFIVNDAVRYKLFRES